MNFFSTVYAPVKVSENPKKDAWYSIINNNIPLDSRWWDNENGWQDTLRRDTDEWLEPLVDRYIFTKEELEKTLKDFVDATVYAPYNELGYKQKVSLFMDKLKSQQ